MLFKNLLMILTSVSFTFAGSFSGWSEKDVTSDPYTNLVYIGINSTIKRPISKSEKLGYNIVNYMVFNPVDSSKHFIFTTEQQKNIDKIIFETKYDSTKQSLVFNVSQENYYMYDGNPAFIVNNEYVEKRPPKDRILIISNKGYDKPSELWVCNKKGENVQLLTEVQSIESWHLDIKNSKIRVVSPKGFSTTITQFDW